MIEKKSEIYSLSQSPRKGALQVRNRFLHPINRNYSSTKLVQLNFIDFQHPRKGCENQGYSQHLPSIQRQEKSASNSNISKKAYFKQRYSLVRKNGLNSIKSHDSLKKISYIHELQQPKNDFATLLNEQQAILQPKSNNSIPLKRMALQKRGQYKLKLQQKNEAKAQKESKLSDVSFQDGLKTVNVEEQKLPSKGTIFSQDLLGKGLRKNSKPKLKALVTNPFDRAMKQDALSQIEKQLKKQEFDQSRIQNHMEQSSASVAQVKQIDELLQMMGN